MTFTGIILGEPEERIINGGFEIQGGGPYEGNALGWFGEIRGTGDEVHSGSWGCEVWANIMEHSAYVVNTDQEFSPAINGNLILRFGMWARNVSEGSAPSTLMVGFDYTDSYEFAERELTDEWQFFDFTSEINRTKTLIGISLGSGLAGEQPPYPYSTVAQIDDVTLIAMPTLDESEENGAFSHISDVKMSTSSTVAKRPVINRSEGEEIDLGTWTFAPIQLSSIVRVSPIGKSTIETLFNANSIIPSLFLLSDSGLWKFTNAWIKSKEMVFENSVDLDGINRMWKVSLVILAESAEFMGL